MATYLVLNIVVMAVIGVVILWFRTHLNWRLIASIAALLLILTAIFDSLIIHFGIVAYATDKITGLFIGKAPIEDFTYTLVAVVLVPYVWVKLKGNHETT